MKASGKTSSCAPFAAASAISPSARSMVAGVSSSTDEVCATAAISLSWTIGSAPPVRNVVRAERHRDVLRLQEHLVAPGAAFASGAAGLGAAEGLAQVAHVLAVDEAHAGFDGGGDAVRAADVLAPDVAGQAVLHVVGLGDRIRLVVERDQARDRAEDLLLRDAHRVLHVGEDRRPDRSEEHTSELQSPLN